MVLKYNYLSINQVDRSVVADLYNSLFFFLYSSLNMKPSIIQLSHCCRDIFIKSSESKKSFNVHNGNRNYHKLIN